MGAVAELESNPVSKHQIQPECNESEHADAGRDGRTCLARPTPQARTGTGKKHFSCLADLEHFRVVRVVGDTSYVIIVGLLSTALSIAYCSYRTCELD